MTSPARPAEPKPADSPPLALEELQHLLALSRRVDDLLEESLRARENVAATFARCLPDWLLATGATGAVVFTLDEALEQQTFEAGSFGGESGPVLLERHPEGVAEVEGGVFVSQPLDVAGMQVGSIGLFHAQNARPVAALRRELDVIAEELDTVLVTIQTAAEKHQLVVSLNERLADPVFEQGLDAAIFTLARKVRFPGLTLVFRDALQPSVLRYRSYVDGKLQYESGAHPWPALEAAIAKEGQRLVAPANQTVKQVVGGHRATEAVLIPGSQKGESLGKIVVMGDAGGFSSFALDLIRVLAVSLTQRLLDYNRERIHLSQFFSNPVIDELLRDPDYARKYLGPRVEEVAILFVDINGFTRICEQVLEAPSRIGHFVNRWSTGAVEIVHRHGGVFDKMVGDCVIGLFGPPFFHTSPEARAEAAVRAALDIQRFTQGMSSDPDLARLHVAQLEGLGVAGGINLAPTCCGLFGPNHAYTGFSTGMNQTARLQALGGFRELLVMERVRDVLAKSADPMLRALTFGPITETPVKNVAHPLRHCDIQRPDGE